MAAPKTDKSSNTAAAPFATKDGDVPADGSKTIEKGTDFTANPRGQGIVAGARDFTKESRPQGAPEAPGAQSARPAFAGSRPQTPGSIEKRVNPTSIPAGGPVTKADPGAASKAVGAQGLDRPRPFKNMKGG